MARTPRLLLVGATEGSNIGGSLFRAAKRLQLDVRICDTAAAWRIGSVAQKVVWRFAGRRPLRLRSFSESVLQECRQFKPSVLLTTGRAPLDLDTLAKGREMGIRLVNFSTDDPFNKQMHSPWFLRGLPLYDVVFTPRQINVDELRRYGCRDVRYIPFGYDSELFYYDPQRLAAESGDDLFFAGHVENSRLEYIAAALEKQLSVKLYGAGWDQHPVTRAYARGEADIPTLRGEAGDCKTALCVVRHDNRDGHSMRSFELAACGACMLVETTTEHEEIFGSEGCVEYFKSPAQMVEQARSLLEAPAERVRMRNAVHQRITQGKNTYADRLRMMLSLDSK